MSPQITFFFIRVPLGLYYTNFFDHTYFSVQSFFTTAYTGKFIFLPKTQYDMFNKTVDRINLELIKKNKNK